MLMEHAFSNQGALGSNEIKNTSWKQSIQYSNVRCPVQEVKIIDLDNQNVLSAAMKKPGWQDRSHPTS